MRVRTDIARREFLAGALDLTVVVDHMADCPLNQPKELDKLLALNRDPELHVEISHS